MNENTPEDIAPEDIAPEDIAPEDIAPEDIAPDAESIEDRRARARARSEAKNQAVRDQLEPLAPGERPLAVTIASIAAMVFAVGNFLAYLLSDNDLSDQDQKRALVQLAFICGILVVASIGMWLTKYWAVLGFQTILGLQIIVYSLAVTRAEGALTVLLCLTIITASSILFWFLIRAMARIQMPEAPDIKKLEERAAEREAAQRERDEEENND